MKDIQLDYQSGCAWRDGAWGTCVSFCNFRRCGFTKCVFSMYLISFMFVPPRFYPPPHINFIASYLPAAPHLCPTTPHLCSTLQPKFLDGPRAAAAACPARQQWFAEAERRRDAVAENARPIRCLLWRNGNWKHRRHRVCEVGDLLYCFANLLNFVYTRVCVCMRMCTCFCVMLFGVLLCSILLCHKPSADEHSNAPVTRALGSWKC